MASLTDRRKATQRRALSKQRARIKLRNQLNGQIAKARRNIGVRRRLIDAASGNPGEKAVRALSAYAGKVETSNNDAPWLRTMEDRLPHDRLDWMIPGNPYCGLGCIAGWWEGSKKLLPDDTVSTIAIASRAARNDGFTKVGFGEIHAGDLIVMHFGSGGPKHVGLAKGPMKGGVVPTIEANTSPNNGGSQSNGGGVFHRTRAAGLIHTVARPT